MEDQRETEEGANLSILIRLPCPSFFLGLPQVVRCLIILVKQEELFE